MARATVEAVSNVVRSESIGASTLRLMTQQELVDLYHQLDPPTFDEMHGEYAASLLDQGSRLSNVLNGFAINAGGIWLCKAFKPTGANEGRGYNGFRGRGGVVRRFRMRTRIGPSKLDDDERDAFHLEYADLNSLGSGGPIGALLHTMFDELRKADSGVYLGLGRVGFTARARRRLYPFLLEGPVAPFAE